MVTSPAFLLFLCLDTHAEKVALSYSYFAHFLWKQGEAVTQWSVAASFHRIRRTESGFVSSSLFVHAFRFRKAEFFLSAIQVQVRRCTARDIVPALLQSSSRPFPANAAPVSRYHARRLSVLAVPFMGIKSRMSLPHGAATAPLQPHRPCGIRLGQHGERSLGSIRR